MSCSFGADEGCCGHHHQPGWVGEVEGPVGQVGEGVRPHQLRAERQGRMT